MSCKVLVVDDNQDAADVLAILLSHLGYTTLVAYNGQQAIDLLDSFNPRVVLLDINMPVLNGYQTASLIRSLPDSQRFHIIALTANDDDDSIARMVEAGCNSMITKPAAVEDLLKLFP